MILDSGFSLEDDLPIQFIEKYRLGSLNEIVKLAHFPRNVQDVKELEEESVMRISFGILFH